VPVNISSSGTPTVYSNLEILDQGYVTDINVLDLAGTHTYISDLTVSLNSPDDTQVILFDGICGNQNDWDLNFDDEAAPGDIPCPPTTGGTYKPLQPLSLFDGTGVLGTWTLEIDDQANLDGGALESWALQICLSEYVCNKTVVNTNSNGPGSFPEVFNCAADGDTITIDNSLAGATFVLTAELVFDRDIFIKGPDGNAFIFDASGLQTAMTFNESTHCEIENVTIYSGSGPEPGAIINDGNLRLLNVTLSSQGSPPSQGILRNNGILLLEGDCHVSQ